MVGAESAQRLVGSASKSSLLRQHLRSLRAYVGALAIAHELRCAMLARVGRTADVATRGAARRWPHAAYSAMQTEAMLTTQAVAHRRGIASAGAAQASASISSIVSLDVTRHLRPSYRYSAMDQIVRTVQRRNGAGMEAYMEQS
jgi:hypothetical protein